MRKTLIVWMLLLISNVGWTQKTEIKIVVVDYETKEAVPYATVVFLTKNGGVYTDKTGTFYVNNVDSVLIRHVSYQPQVVKVAPTLDSVFMENQSLTLGMIEVQADRKQRNEKVKYKFSRQQKLRFSLTSFEFGKVVSVTNNPVSNVQIPCIKPERDVVIALKLYTVADGIPDSLVYKEIQVVSKDSNDFLSFGADISVYSKSDQMFVSIEMMSDMEYLNSLKNPMKLYLDIKQDSSRTYATRNFDVTKKWVKHTNEKQQPMNLVLFSE